MEKQTKQSSDEITSKIFKERDTYQQANQQARNVINEIHEAIQGDTKDSKDKSKSQEKIKKLRTALRYIIPSIFSGNPEFEASIVGEEDSDLAFVGEKIVNKLFDTIPNAYAAIEAWVSQSAGFGTSLIWPSWNIEYEEDEQGNKTILKDEVDLTVDNILDDAYNPILSEVEKQESIIRRFIIPVSEAKENTSYDFKGEDGKLNREKIESKSSFNSNNYDSSRQVAGDKIDLQKAAAGTVEIYERVSSDRLQTVCDGKTRLILRDVPNQYDFINAVKLIHEPNIIPNRFEGIGAGHDSLGLGKKIQRLSNRLEDAVNLGNNPHFIGKKGAGIDKSQLVIKPGGFTEVDGDGPLDEQFHALQLPDVKQGGLEILSRFDDDFNRANGANDLVQGAASNKTLGQDQMASSYSSQRFELINRRFKVALSNLGMMLLKMIIINIQSIDSSILKIFPLQAELAEIQAKNPNSKLISREYAYALLLDARTKKNIQWNIQVKGETNIARNKAVEVKQATDMFNLFAPLLPPKYQFAWMRKIAEKGRMDGIDELIPDDEFLQSQGQPQDPTAQVGPATGQPMQGAMMDQSQMGMQQVQQPNPMM